MAAPVPAGTYIITSVQYPDNAADLYGGNADGNIIGYPEHGKLNQQVRAISRYSITNLLIIPWMSRLFSGNFDTLVKVSIRFNPSMGPSLMPTQP
jgi:hypothetical protein